MAGSSGTVWPFSSSFKSINADQYGCDMFAERPSMRVSRTSTFCRDITVDIDDNHDFVANAPLNERFITRAGKIWDGFITFFNIYYIDASRLVISQSFFKNRLAAQQLNYPFCHTKAHNIIPSS
ncbi:hypothetical protein D3C78_1108770 [compost metagenome]